MVIIIDAMKKQRIYLFLFFLFLISKSFAQGFLVTSPKLNFSGNQLDVSYDVISKKSADHFYVWLEIEKKTGEPLPAKSLAGDIGEHIRAGTNKHIIWVPEKDGIFLNEEVLVEIKAEKYVKSFNKGSAMLLSAIMPGLGQTKISNGKPYWLTGVFAYGALAGGFVFHSAYLNTFDSYKVEPDPAKRSELFNKTQQQMNLSSALLISGAALWTANIFWVALVPNRYQPLKYAKMSFNPSVDPYKGTTLLSMRLNF